MNNETRYKKYEELTAAELHHIIKSVILSEQAKTPEDLIKAKEYAKTLHVHLTVLEA
jgi:hypothetical protein